MAGYPLNHAFTAVPATIGRAISAYGPDIYQNAFVRRAIYPIRAQIEPGNSGGPLLAPDGKVYGVVFAASTSYRDTGYALAASQVARDVGEGENAYTKVSTQACQGG